MKITEYRFVRRREYRYNVLKLQHIWNPDGSYKHFKKIYIQIYIHTPGLTRGFDYSCKGASAPTKLETYPGSYYDMRASFWVVAPLSLYVESGKHAYPIWTSSRTPFDSCIVAYLVRGGARIFYNREQQLLILDADPTWVVRDDDEISDWWPRDNFYPKIR